MVLTVLVSINDASSALHFRSALRHITDSILCYLFSYAQYHDFSSQHLWMFCNLHLYGDCGGPSSISRRTLLHFSENIAFRTHYVVYFDYPFWIPPLICCGCEPTSVYHRRFSFLVLRATLRLRLFPHLRWGIKRHSHLPRESIW